VLEKGGHGEQLELARASLLTNRTWLTGGVVLSPAGPVRAVVGWSNERLLSLRGSATARDERIAVRGCYVAPGFVDLHAWGEPAAIAADGAQHGTTAFLTTLGPSAPEELARRLVAIRDQRKQVPGCLGAHLEGPFLNPEKAGALPKRWIRAATHRELRQLGRVGDTVRLMTLAPETPNAFEAIRWCRRHRVAVSMGHTDADAAAASVAIRAGARAVTHAFNGMRPFHHRDPGLIGQALLDPRVSAMVILDGIHISPMTFELLLRCKGPEGLVLVTDAVGRAHGLWSSIDGGAYYRKPGVLAGSTLTMMRAVQNAVRFGKIAVHDAVRMASLNPSLLIGEARQRGTLEPGKRADVVVFDRDLRVVMTVIGGQIVYRRRVP